MTTHQRTPLDDEADANLQRMVESVGVKVFSDAVGLSTRQVNRILAGAQPNPLARTVRFLQSCDTESGDQAIAFLCQEIGGHFVRDEPTIDSAKINAVKECAEAIAAISDGKMTKPDQREVREAISALCSLLKIVTDEQR
ncbi:MAG: hypothetical protein ACF8GE_10770 [Phycisphaerales bacterium JB043]